MSASRLLSTQLTNVYQIGLAVIGAGGGKDSYFEVENANKEKADDTEQWDKVPEKMAR